MQQLIPVVCLALSLSLQSAGTTASAPNTLTPAEKAAGWQLLFDGRSLDGWRGYRRDPTSAIAVCTMATGSPPMTSIRTRAVE